MFKPCIKAAINFNAKNAYCIEIIVYLKKYSIKNTIYSQKFIIFLLVTFADIIHIKDIYRNNLQYIN